MILTKASMCSGLTPRQNQGRVLGHLGLLPGLSGFLTRRDRPETAWATVHCAILAALMAKTVHSQTEVLTLLSPTGGGIQSTFHQLVALFVGQCQLF